MYNGHEYLSCIKLPAEINKKQAATRNKPEKAEPMDLTAEHRDLISVANKAFGENNWSHTVVNQTLDFVEMINAKYCTGCVSFVKIQLKNGNSHEDIGYCSAEESTKGLSIHNARIGSAVNALRRVLLSFGEKIQKELQNQISPERANNVKDVAQSLDKQISEKSNVSVNKRFLISMPLVSTPSKSYTYVTSSGDYVAVPTLQTECTNKSNKLDQSRIATVVSTVNNSTKTSPSSSVKLQNVKIFAPLIVSNKTNSTSEQKLKLAYTGTTETNSSAKVESVDTSLNKINSITEQQLKPASTSNDTTKANLSSSIKVESDPSPNETNSTNEQKSKSASTSNDTTKINQSSSIKVESVNPSSNKTNFTNEQKSKSASTNNDTSKANLSSSIKVESVDPSPNKTNSTNEQKSKSELSAILRMERKRRQMEKQMEFKRRMMEKEGSISTSDNKPDPK